MITRLFFTDELGMPLLKGTAISLEPYSPHWGIIDYLPTGEQVVHHNSKRHGRAVTTWPEEFNDGHIPVCVVAMPLSVEDGERICQNARLDVKRGIPWSPGDNCQDFVTRAYVGRNGSPTRDGFFAAACFVGSLVLAAQVWDDISQNAR